MDKALLRRVEKQAWFNRYPRALPLLLFALTLLVTAGAAVAIERQARAANALRLDRNAAEVAAALQRRTSDNIASLGAAAAVFSARGDVSAQAFVEFAQALHYSQGNALGAVGIGWAPRIDVRTIPAFEASMRGAGAKDFTVHPRVPGARIATPIVVTSPMTPTSHLAMGYDMYTEPARRVAIDAAMRLGRPTVSALIHLQRDTGQRPIPGFAIYMPVFAPLGHDHPISGFVYSPFRGIEFLNSALELVGTRHINVAIYDGGIAPEHLLAIHAQPGRPVAASQRMVLIGDHPWTLVLTDTETGLLSPATWVAIAVGLAAASLLTGMTQLFIRRAQLDRQVLEWFTSQAAIRDSLTRELNHRVKNTLANVLSIVSLTRSRYRDIGPYAQSLTERIRALSTTYDLLSQSEWRSAAMHQIVENELAPYIGNDGQVDLNGPEIRLAANDALSLGLAIHELATNAAKYGALSTNEGKVRIAWRLMTPDLAEISWAESGGPPVSPPTRRGFGMELIEKIVAAELRTDVKLNFATAGVECRLRAPVRPGVEFTPG